MNNGVNLVLAESSFDQGLIAHVASHNPGLLNQTSAHKLALGHPVAHETDDVGSGGQQA